MKPRRRARQHQCGVLVLVPLLGALAVAPAFAAGSVSCGFAATPLVFGQYMPLSNAPTDFNATITVSCVATGTTAMPLQGTIGLLGAGTSQGRQLSDGGATLRYQIYLNPARTMLWGDGTGREGTQAISGIVSSATPFRQSFTVYGRILARQSNAKVGTYADRIAVILNY